MRVSERPTLADPRRHWRQQLCHAWRLITRNWAAEPLTDYNKILGLIRKTTTTTGLKVSAYLDTNDYPVKVKPSAQRLRQLRITRHATLPKWNYTIAPSNGN